MVQFQANQTNCRKVASFGNYEFLVLSSGAPINIKSGEGGPALILYGRSMGTEGGDQFPQDRYSTDSFTDIWWILNIIYKNGFAYQPENCPNTLLHVAFHFFVLQCTSRSVPTYVHRMPFFLFPPLLVLVLVLLLLLVLVRKTTLWWRRSTGAVPLPKVPTITCIIMTSREQPYSSF